MHGSVALACNQGKVSFIACCVAPLSVKAYLLTTSSNPWQKIRYALKTSGSGLACQCHIGFII